jgi:hypothetical protein
MNGINIEAKTTKLLEENTQDKSLALVLVLGS